ncbi:acetyltransferase-related [Schistosoma mansoni]|uniref:Acetyltransferase-related n=1 Tax=Schistosoma mansoni TaxID=6183 RepID=G4VTW0_SCHMA|nr:acetyltransferase-related [Schistosoma mansoni]|eukprot:XP_018654704.1 acetyltransferase-related [Schistosoma mansoni]
MGSCIKQECSDSQSLREKNSLTSDNIEHEGDIFTPFTYQCRISKLQYIKMYLLTVTIFPFRALMVGLSFLISLFISNIFTTGYSSKSQVKPICDFRRWLILPIVRMSARFAFFAGGFHWIKVQGVRASRKEAPIMVIAPHSSFLDALIVVALGMPSIVGKTESAESFVGGFFRLLQPILVNREDPNSRKKTIQELIRRAKSEEDWPQIVIFPEGTCTNRSCIATFKPGAFNAGVPVQPVIVRWPNKVDCVTWVCEGPGVLKLLWLLMSQFNNRLEIEFLPVYQPNEDEQLDAQLYANNIRRIMAEHLNVPLCDLSYDDFCQIRIAFKHKIPGYEAVVYLNSLLQMMFALEQNCDLITDEDKQTEWFQIRFESMLGVCRSKPYLSRLEFIQTLFQTSQPNSKANYLINLVAKYYSDPSSNNLNFRICMVHISMLLFPKLPHQAFYYATKAYNLCASQTHVNVAKVWEISRSDAAELLSFAFTLENDETVKLILDRAYLIKKSTHSDNSSSGISGEHLYEGLLYHLPDVANCYAHFDAEINKVFGRHRRPLIDSSSTSKNDLSDLKPTHSIPVVNSLNATSCPDITTISNKKAQILPNHFECIDVTEIPPIVTENYSEKLSNSPHKDDQSLNFRGRYSERGM